MEGYKFATLVVTEGNAPVARVLSAGLSEGGVGMFTAALSADGSEPATHYCSTGWFGEEYIDALESADTLYAKAQEKEAPVTLAICQKLMDESDISAESPFSVFDRMGLKLCAEEV